MTTTYDYSGKIVLVTGAASGMGREIAIQFAKAGAKVGALDFNEEGLAGTLDAIGKAGGDALCIPGDVRRDGDLRAAVDAVVREYGGLDIAIANAGVLAEGTVLDTPLEVWDNLIATDLNGVFYTARHALPEFKKRGGGVFIAIASACGLMGYQENVAYAAAKHGVVGIIRAMALDHGLEGIRTAAVCPGSVETQLLIDFREESPEYAAYLESLNPMGRAGKVQEVAHVVMHLASDEASYTNGMTYSMDGGETAGTFTPGMD